MNASKNVENASTKEFEYEEGELTSTDNGDIDEVDFEYEAISSDEEFTLRQKIEALEARNLELEKIASISARSQDAYGNCVSIAFVYSLQTKFSIFLFRL